MKKAKTIILTILIVLCCGVWAYGIMFVNFFAQDIVLDSLFKKPVPFQKHYLDKWEMSIPENAQLEFKFSHVGGFPQDGEYYLIVKFDSRPDELLESFSNKISKDDLSSYQYAMERLVEHGMDESKVVYPEENYLVDVKNTDFIDKLIIIYDENTNTMYMWEWLP